MLRHPHIFTSDLRVVFPDLAEVDPAILARVDIEGMPSVNFFSIFPFMLPSTMIFLGVYISHLRRQEADLKLFHDEECLLLSPDIDYQEVSGLSEEIREKLASTRPGSIVSPR